MRTIHKQALNIISEQSLSLPSDAKIRSIQVQQDTICIWYEFEPNIERLDIKRTFLIIGTGHKFNEQNLEYIGTVLNGPFVWHIYEQIK